MYSSTTATVVGTAEVSTAGMLQWPDAQQTSYTHTVAPRCRSNRREHARMDLVSNLNLSTTYLDVAVVAPFSSNPALVAAASTRPGYMAKRAEKTKFDRYPHVNLAPFILETTGGPGHHAKKFISNLMKDAGNPPLAIRDTWPAIQSVLHSAISNQQLTAAVT